MADMVALARVAPVSGLGMVMIRADLDRAGDAIAEAAGLPIPARTRIVVEGDRALGWMSPDELLLTLPHAEVPAAVAALSDALSGEHALVADVSDMRCVHDVIGDGADHVLAKLSPTDWANFPADGLRRTRLAQVPAAIWAVPGGFRIIAFRSVTDYVAGILAVGAAPGSWLDPR